MSVPDRALAFRVYWVMGFFGESEDARRRREEWLLPFRDNVLTEMEQYTYWNVYHNHQPSMDEMRAVLTNGCPFEGRAIRLHHNLLVEVYLGGYMGDNW